MYLFVRIVYVRTVRTKLTNRPEGFGQIWGDTYVLSFVLTS